MRNLVLSGGGIKGLLHLGALKSLEEKQLLKNVENYGGSSAGSLVALLLCIGYTYNDIMIVFLKINLDKFYDITDIFEFLNIYGLINLDPSEKLLRILLENKFNKKKITFKELYDLTKKTLHINSINLNSNEEDIFNYINTPNVDVIDACIASCSLPFIFPPKLINNNNYIDAFAVNNCPCNIFKNDLDNTICLSIRECPTENNFKKIDGFQNYIINVFNSFEKYSNNNNKNIYKPKIIINLSYNCSPIDFDLSKNILSDIFIKGYNISNEYLNNNSTYENLENTDEELEEVSEILENTDEKLEEVNEILENMDDNLEEVSEIFENMDDNLEEVSEIFENMDNKLEKL